MTPPSIETTSDRGHRGTEPDERERAALTAIRFNQRVAEKAEELKVLEAARARIIAEKEADVSFDDLYLSRTDLLSLPAPEPLIERVLPRHSYAILRGRDQSFKSFVAIDWACCLATGRPWQGHDAEPTRVLYIAGEGAHGIAARIEAWEDAWSQIVPADMLTVRRAALNLHRTGAAFTDLLARIEDSGYGLVIVDTLRRVSGAADGNSSEMGLVMDNLDRIKLATQEGSVLVVAHTDKSDHDSRGFSGIEDDADVVWHAKRDEMFLTLTLTKMKDGSDGRNIHLKAIPTLRSLVVSGATGTPNEEAPESQLKILETMRDVFPDGASGPDVMAISGLPRTTFYRAIGELLDAGHVLNTGTRKRKFYELPVLPVDTSDQPPNLGEPPRTNPLGGSP